MAVGEAAGRKGDDGARRAKRWLEATTRVKAAWTNEDEVHVSRLVFDWPHSSHPFSYDLGGMLAGESFDGHFFLGESKNYTEDAADQGTHYDDWVAKCYVTRAQDRRVSDQFMWITWHPFRIGKWKTLCTEAAVVEGLLVPRNMQRIFDTEDPEVARGLIDHDLVKEVASRLWLVVLSAKQEQLVITRQHRSWIMERQVLEGQA